PPPEACPLRDGARGARRHRVAYRRLVGGLRNVQRRVLRGLVHDPRRRARLRCSDPAPRPRYVLGLACAPPKPLVWRIRGQARGSPGRSASSRRPLRLSGKKPLARLRAAAIGSVTALIRGTALEENFTQALVHWLATSRLAYQRTQAELGSPSSRTRRTCEWP